MESGLGRPAVQDLLCPDVIAERCVHSQMEQASCRSCADACPRRAWIIDDERLGVDADLCDGCGLCAPACPEGAIAERFEPVCYSVGDISFAFAACSRAGLQDEVAGVIPCLHVLGVRALLELYRRGVRQLVSSRGKCEDCPRSASMRIERHLELVAALLEARFLEPLQFDDLSAEHWRRRLLAAKASQRPLVLGRRAFFRSVLTAAANRAAELSDQGESGVPDFVPPGQVLPKPNGTELELYAPCIDPSRCTGCDACARLCPHNAIRTEAEAYQFDPANCTACMICVDVCTEGAVSVNVLDPAPQTSLPLDKRRCRACGVPFHAPKAHADRGDVCSICATANHNKRLFQVLD